MRKTLKKQLKKIKSKKQKGNGGCQSVLITSDSSSSSGSNSNEISQIINNLGRPIVDARKLIEISPKDVTLVNPNVTPIAKVVSCNNYTKKSGLKKKYRKFPNKRKKTKRRMKTSTNK